MTFKRAKHAMIDNYHPSEFGDEPWYYYTCRCGKGYFSPEHWGHASRAEARVLHREHLERVKNGTEEEAYR